MLKNIEIGIANFKPFGEKIQRFKLKPITLIYGPNSIGKSSVVHSIAYSHNIFQNNMFDVSEINLGDKISLGGFSQFVHKKNVENDITIEYSFNPTIEHHADHYRSGDYTAKKKLKSFTFEKIKNSMTETLEDTLIDDEGDFYLHAGDYDINSFIDDNILSGLDEWSKLSDEEKKVGWENRPTKELQRFLNIASLNTVALFDSINPKYLLYTETDNTKWFNFNYRNFAKILIDDDSKMDSFCLDVLKYIDVYSENVWPDIKDPNITIKTVIGKYNDEIVDKSVNYYVGNEVLIETLRIEPAEEKSYSNDPIKRSIEELMDSFSGESKSLNRYVIQINTSHWMIQKLINDLTEDNKKENINSKPSIKDLISDTIATNFQGADSILLSLDENMYDTYPLMKLISNHVEDLKSFKKSLEKDYEEYESSPTMYDEYDDVYENAKLFELLENLNINSIDDVIFRIINSWMCSVNSSLKIHQSNFKYIGPLRNLPERHEFSFSEDVQSSFESNSIWHLIKNNSDIRDKLNQWLSSDKLKTPYELKIQKHIKIDDKSIEQLKSIIDSEANDIDIENAITNQIDTINEMAFYDKRYDTPVNIREMGLGISQVLPIIISLLNDKSHTIAVEQPELHLHPSVQSDLADEFIKSYKDNNNTSLIETHSEHLLLRMMRRMRQTSEGTLEDEKLTLTPNDVSLLYVDADDSKTYILELELSEDGSLLDPWPGGFFEEGFRERFL